MNRIEICFVCGDRLSEKRIQKKASYCSDKCSKIAQKIRWENVQDIDDNFPKISRSTSGAMRELLVCSSLMKHGFSVFRAMSPACSCDILAMKEDEIYRIECTTGYKNLSGGWSWSQHNNSNYDIIAVVFPSDEIKWMDNKDDEIKI